MRNVLLGFDGLTYTVFCSKSGEISLLSRVIITCFPDEQKLLTTVGYNSLNYSCRCLLCSEAAHKLCAVFLLCS